jgi:DNA-binding CsgD family transcriptional regulator
LAAFGLWARVNRVQRWIVRGLFPGIVGFGLVHIAVYVAQIVDMGSLWAGRLEIFGLSASALFWVRFDAFLLYLVFEKRGRKWGRQLTIGVFPVGLICGALAFGPDAWQSMDLDVLGLVTLTLGILGVVTAWKLKVSPDDIREKVELKHLFQPIPFVFFALFPFVLIDVLWGAGESVFGIKYTVGMVQFLVFNLMYLRFFARWVAFQVGTQQTAKAPGTVRLEPTADVSPREADIVRLVARGLSNKEIADALSISPNTVKNHLYSIFSKVKVQSRVQLVQWWNSTGA